MKNRKIANILIISILFSISLISDIPRCGARTPLEITDIIEDGYIDRDGDDPYDYTRFSTGDQIRIYYNIDNRGYIEWNISSIPNNAILDKVSIKIKSESGEGDVDIYHMANEPKTSSDSTVYIDAKDGSLYKTTPAASPETWYTYELSSQAKADISSKLSGNITWFAIGMYSAPNNNYWKSEETGNTPVLIVEYHMSSDFLYGFNGLYYENGTRSGTVNITLYFPTIDTDTFEVDGEETKYLEEHPILITFLVGTDVRRLYCKGSEENFTIFTPETYYSNYGFTIKDYTGKLGEGDSYLEAYRGINGSEELIERMKIYDSYNVVPLTLTVGKVYHLKILWGDKTEFDWGYYIPITDTGTTLIIRDVQFSDQIQLTYEYLRVVASRPSSTQITVDYEDVLDETNSVGISIALRNGTVVHTDSSTSSTKVFNWNGAVNTTDYKVTTSIDHETFSIKAVTHYLDANQSFGNPLDIEVLGSFGGLQTGNILAFTIAVFFMGAFSYQFGSTAGIASALTIVSLMTYWGWANYSTPFLTLCWFIGIIIMLRGAKG